VQQLSDCVILFFYLLCQGPRGLRGGKGDVGSQGIKGDKVSLDVTHVTHTASCYEIIFIPSCVNFQSNFEKVVIRPYFSEIPSHFLV